MKRLLFLALLAPVLLWRLVAALREPPRLIAARHPWMTFGLIGIVLAIGGLAVATSGIIGITASAGHWSVTERFLQFSKRRSVVTHALRITAPPLDDQSLVLRGATHYDLGCRPCHGATAGEIPQLARRMLPPPPELNVRVPLWRPRELFYIVKHGIKLTGMPAWPAQQRDDEVWAMVAFLGRLPEMRAAEYQRLTRGESMKPFDLGTEVAPPPEVVAETCARCHGRDGNGRGPGAFPKLAGQRAAYLDGALRAYADGRRHSGVMGPIAAALSAEARRHAADYYAALPASPGPDPDRSSVARGEALAVEGNPVQMIPPCIECHGRAATPKNPAYPILDGQYQEYLALQLRLLRDRQRGGSEYVHLMHNFIDRLRDEQLHEAAAYFASRR
jgi:cytochrome c553